MSKSPSLRRIQADIRELALDPSDRYHAAPLENDMFEWHFTIRGADGTDFEGGIYHGRILLPPEYPFKPPHIVMLTPSGRFETNTKVCLSFSAFHPELWQPAWGIRLILEALISFLPTPADGAVGAIDWSSAERKKLAQKSVQFECSLCGKVADLLPELKPQAASSGNGGQDSKPKNRFQKEIEELQRLQMSNHQKEITTEKEKDQEVSKMEVEEPTTKMEVVETSAREQTDPEADQSNETPDKVVADPLLLVPESPAIPAENKDPPPLLSADGVATDANEKDSSILNDQAASPNKVDSGANNKEQPSDVPVPIPVPDMPQQQQPQHQLFEQRPGQQNEHQRTSLMDPILQGIILLLSVICYLLLRKVQALMGDLNALE